MIDVGQGESILVEFPGRRTMLIDGGGLASGPFDVGDKVVSPVLWRKGIKRVDALVLTHPHPDHLDGLIAVARNFRVGEFWEGLAGEERGTLCGASQGPAAESRPAPLRPRRASRDRARFDRCPPPARPPPGPPAAARTRIRWSSGWRWGGRPSFSWGMRDRKRSGPSSSPASISGAPCSRRATTAAPASTSAAFLAAVRPKLVLVSVGEGNTYGFPGRALLDRCGRAGARILRTDLDGAIEIRTDGGQLSVRTAAARMSSGNTDFRLTRTTKSMIIAVD